MSHWARVLPLFVAGVTVYVSVLAGLVHWSLVAVLGVFFASMTVAAAVDAETALLPNRVTAGVAAVCAPVVAVTAILGGGSLTGLVLGCCYWTVICGGLWLATRGRAIGGGDVKLAPTVGAVLGFVAPAAALITLFLSFIVAGLVGAIRGGDRRAAFAPAVVWSATVSVPVGCWVQGIYGSGMGG